MDYDDFCKEMDKRDKESELDGAELELSHSARLGQTVNTTWDRFVGRYLFGRYDTEKDRVYKELCETGKSKLTDEDGTLYIY